MRILSLVGVVLPADDAAASRDWYAGTLGLASSEDVDGALDVNDIAVSFGVQPGLRFVAVELPDGPTTMTDPGGVQVELIEPDYAAAAEGEQHIRDFIDSAARLDGPAVDELATATAAVVRQARQQLTELMDGVPHNKVLATQLALSQQARMEPSTPPDWVLHAASTLLSGLVVAGVQPEAD
jgi:catechol 2,3-dioxygenase-like lactoylglutathione lyase family enzyme